MPSTSSTPSCTPSLIAPRWHTALFVALLLSAPVLAALLAIVGHPAPTPAGSRIVTQYLPFLVTEWSLVGLLWLGCRRISGVTLAGLVGARPSPRQALMDLLLALLAWLLVMGVERVWPGQHAAAILPASTNEKWVWILVACTAAFAEELIFRDYLQRQIATLTDSVSLGIAGQAMLFAVIHSDQGAQACLKIGLYGVGFGVMAHRRGNLRAGMLCHVGIDLMSGLFGL